MQSSTKEFCFHLSCSSMIIDFSDPIFWPENVILYIWQECVRSWVCLSALCWSWGGIVTPPWNGMFNKTFHVHVQPLVGYPATLQTFCKKYWLTKFPWGILEDDLCPPSRLFASAETLTTDPVHSVRDVVWRRGGAKSREGYWKMNFRISENT